MGIPDFHWKSLAGNHSLIFLTVDSGRLHFESSCINSYKSYGFTWGVVQKLVVPVRTYLGQLPVMYTVYGHPRWLAPLPCHLLGNADFPVASASAAQGTSKKRKKKLSAY